EQNNCGLLAREQLCSLCPRRIGCSWPRQYGKRLRGVKLILTTQHHLVLNPSFVNQLRHYTQAKRPLVLLDESDLLVRAAEKTITAPELERFITAQETLPAELQKERWPELCKLVAAAPTPDLQTPGWFFPFVELSWALEVQKAGRQIYGPEF